MESSPNTDLRNVEKLGSFPSNKARARFEEEVSFEQLNYDCPICLGAFRVVHSDLEEGISGFRASFSRVPIHRDDCYQLDTCRHILCRSCLTSYCKSKISNGILNIPCCYPLNSIGTSESSHGKRTRVREMLEWEMNTHSTCTGQTNTCDDDDIHINNIETNNRHRDTLVLCGAIFTDQDVEQIILHTIYSAGADQEQQLELYSRYNKRKFDYRYGDAIRRCPNCDTARLFQFYNVKNEDLSANTLSLSQSDVEQQQKQQQKQQQQREQSPNNIDSSPQREALPIKQTPIIPIVHCLECDTEFCYFHSNVHTGRTCEEYEDKLQEDKESSEYLRNHCKQCPICGINIQKVDGCDHIQCLMCQTKFNWSSLSESSGHHFLNHDENFSFIRAVCRIYDMYFGFCLIGHVLFLPFAPIFILAIAFTGVSCLFSPYYHNYDHFHVCFIHWWAFSWFSLHVYFFIYIVVLATKQ